MSSSIFLPSSASMTARTASGGSAGVADWSPVIGSADVFENLSDDELSLIAKETVERHFEANAVVCEEGSASDTMFFIDSGAVSVAKQGVALARLDAGDYFGEMSLITGAPRNATVTTASPAELIEISAQVFHVIIARSPQATRNLLSTLDERLRRHNDKVVWQYLQLKEQYEELENSHQRLLLSDKLASIGLLTAGIAADNRGYIWVAENDEGYVRRVDPTQIPSGGEVTLGTADGTEALVFSAVDAAGNGTTVIDIDIAEPGLYDAA